MKIPIYVIAGFLGAGKTTFLNQLLYQIPRTLRAAIVVNEFGKIAVDGKLIEKDGYAMKEITQGCVCCTLQADLAVALDHMIRDLGPDVFVIEATGLARPAQMRTVFDFDMLSERVVPKETVCLLDASLFADVGDDLPILHFQIKESDVILLNKVDLLDPGTLDGIRTRLEGISGKPVYETTFAEIDCKTIFPDLKSVGCKSSREGRDRRRGSRAECSADHPNIPENHVHQQGEGEGEDLSTEGYTSIAVRTPKALPLQALKAFLESLRNRLVRVKGVLKTDEGDKVVQISSSGLHLADHGEAVQEGVLVFILRDEEMAAAGDRIRSFFEPFDGQWEEETGRHSQRPAS